MKILREPLVQFFFLGACLYGAYSLWAEPMGTTAPPKQIITIDKNRIDWLKAAWQKTWRRSPTEEELQRQIARYEKETIYYREAMALGLDKGDNMIRRHLAEKLKFLREDLVVPSKPSRQVLLQYYQAHLQRYTIPPRYSFQHLYFNPELRGEAVLDDAEQALARLKKAAQASADIAADKIFLDNPLNNKGEKALSRMFGNRFVDALRGKPERTWFGPVSSGHGVHLVYITSRSASDAPAFEEVAERVAYDWGRQKQQRLNDDYYRRLQQKYQVVIDLPQEKPGEPALHIKGG